MKIKIYPRFRVGQKVRVNSRIHELKASIVFSCGVPAPQEGDIVEILAKSNPTCSCISQIIDIGLKTLAICSSYCDQCDVDCTEQSNVYWIDSSTFDVIT